MEESSHDFETSPE